MKKDELTFKQANFIPPDLDLVQSSPVYMSRYGWLTEIALLSDKSGNYILCKRSKILKPQQERKAVLKKQGMAAAHNALYVHITNEEASRLRPLLGMAEVVLDGELKNAFDSFVSGVFERIGGFKTSNDTFEPQIYGFAAYNTEDELIAFNRLFPPCDTLRTVQELQKLYEYTSEDARKRYLKSQEKAGAK